MSMQHNGYMCEKGSTQGKLKTVRVMSIFGVSVHLRWHLISRVVPADIEDFFVFVGIVDWHRHVIVGRKNLCLSVLVQNGLIPTRTSSKSSLNLCFNRSEYLSKSVASSLSRLAT